ncbi:hypothetical protein ACFVZJ_21365 [Streptomyces sp. NPDC058322]|uniref:hypothetical protein n=1 Tax=Streptomyces sp. NPDC058322 TaxID=3346446 RepID=UPI0036EFAE2B
MATVFMVQADSQAECAAELSRMCAAFDLRPLLPPTRSTGTERWLARAAPVSNAQRDADATVVPQ